MKRSVNLLILVLLAQLLIANLDPILAFLRRPSAPEAATKTNSPPPSSNMTIAAGEYIEERFDNRIGFRAVIVDLNKSELDLYLTGQDGNNIGDFKALSEHLASSKGSLAFATNAGIFGRDLKPLGLHVANGQLISRLNLTRALPSPGKLVGNFFKVPNGVFYVTNDRSASIVESSELNGVDDWSGFRLATQSGPMLLRRGRIHPEFQPSSKNAKIRSGVGIVDRNRVVFIITTAPVTFYDFSLIFRDRFKCSDALYLDGTISAMHVPEIDGEELDTETFAGILAVRK